MSRQFGVLLLATSLLAAGCAAHSQPSNGASEALRALIDEDWKYWMTQYPELATAYGYPGQNMRWTDYSQSAIDERADHLKKASDRLKGINRRQLNPGDQIN